jgi:DNA-binding NtrC family response regulator
MSLFVLVVDDETDIELLFRQHFRKELRAGIFDMEFALDAQEALAAIGTARDATLILILSDINMPGMSGLDLLPKARAARPEVPIIMISAYGDSETQRKALQGGADGFLTKPIDFGKLREEIRQRVEQAA